MANHKPIPTSVPYIPQHIPGTKPSRDTLIKFYRIAPDGTWEEMKRSDFFKLMKTVACPRQHLCPDVYGGIVYFMDEPTPEQQKVYLELCQKLETLKKRAQRASRCIYFETKKCDGWKPNADGTRRCDSCSYNSQCRTISLDAPISDDEGNEVSYGAHIPSPDANPEEISLRKAERHELALLLSSLPDEDRRLVVASVQEGMDFGKLAEMFGLSNRNYASKKTARILERLRKAAQEFDE